MAPAKTSPQPLRPQPPDPGGHDHLPSRGVEDRVAFGHIVTWLPVGARRGRVQRARRMVVTFRGAAAAHPPQHRQMLDPDREMTACF